MLSHFFIVLGFVLVLAFVLVLGLPIVIVLVLVVVTSCPSVVLCGTTRTILTQHDENWLSVVADDIIKTIHPK